MLLNETNVTCVVAFLPEICDFENPSKVSFFLKTLDFVFIFLWANHGHGNGVRRGVFGDGLSEKQITAGGRRSSFQENPCFWGPTSKVRPFDGTFSAVNNHTWLTEPVELQILFWGDAGRGSNVVASISTFHQHHVFLLVHCLIFSPFFSNSLLLFSFFLSIYSQSFLHHYLVHFSALISSLNDHYVSLSWCSLPLLSFSSCIVAFSHMLFLSSQLATSTTLSLLKNASYLKECTWGITYVLLILMPSYCDVLATALSKFSQIRKRNQLSTLLRMLKAESRISFFIHCYSWRSRPKKELIFFWVTGPFFWVCLRSTQITLGWNLAGNTIVQLTPALALASPLQKKNKKRWRTHAN